MLERKRSFPARIEAATVGYDAWRYLQERILVNFYPHSKCEAETHSKMHWKAKNWREQASKSVVGVSTFSRRTVRDRALKGPKLASDLRYQGSTGLRQ